MRVLVTGGRGYGELPKWCRQFSPEYYRLSQQADAERVALEHCLGGLMPRPTVIIHGAARGADSCAAKWAKTQRIADLPFKANWYPDGFGRLDKSAGPIRNQRMIDEGKPDLVVAFPGGRGTADMVRRAKAAGIKVVDVPSPSPVTGRR